MGIVILSVRLSVCPFVTRVLSANELRVSVSHFRFLIWERSTFILSALWFQNPDLNPVNYKICIEIRRETGLPQKNSYREWADIIVWLAWL